MDQQSGDGRFNGGIEVIAIRCGQEFPIVEMLDAKIASALSKIIQNSHFEEKVSLHRSRKPQKSTGFYEEDRSLSRSTTTFE